MSEDRTAKENLLSLIDEFLTSALRGAEEFESFRAAYSRVLRRAIEHDLSIQEARFFMDVSERAYWTTGRGLTPKDIELGDWKDIPDFVNYLRRERAAYRDPQGGTETRPPLSP
jgi:hypothetical protein